VRKWLTRLGVGVLMLLALATGIMWARSRWRADELRWFVQLPDPTEDDWQGLLGVFRIYSVESSQGAVGFWVRSREVWLSTPFPEPGLHRWSGSPKEPPNCSMDNAFSGGDARCFPNDWGFALRWDVDQPMAGWPYVAHWRVRMIVLPWWVLAAGFGALPVYLLARKALRARFRRLNPGLCHTCGYDLRATPRRCPECGSVPGCADTRAA
jgi:hypothetical protein